MLRSIISYLSFCGRTLREDYQNWKWRGVTDTTLNFARKINNILVAVAAAGIIFFALSCVSEYLAPSWDQVVGDSCSVASGDLPGLPNHGDQTFARANHAEDRS